MESREFMNTVCIIWYRPQVLVYLFSNLVVVLLIRTNDMKVFCRISIPSRSSIVWRRIIDKWTDISVFWKYALQIFNVAKDWTICRYIYRYIIFSLFFSDSFFFFLSFFQHGTYSNKTVRLSVQLASRFAVFKGPFGYINFRIFSI